MRVLIGTDGSDDAVAAAVQGLAILGPPDSVIVACSVDAPVVASQGLESGFGGGIATPDTIEKAWSVVENEADTAIERTVAALPAALTIERVVTDGDAGRALCHLATEREADAIVIGTRGRGAIKRALLGSVSTYVSRHAPCAVVIVPARAGR
ncbi:MAG: universal stress protein [Acidimicrobiia bacterium]